MEKGVVSGGQALAGIILKIELFEEVKMKIVIYEWLRERPRNRLAQTLVWRLTYAHDNSSYWLKVYVC